MNGYYSYTVPNSDDNYRIARAIQANFADIVVRRTRSNILFVTTSEAAILSIRAAYEREQERQP